MKFGANFISTTIVSGNVAMDMVDAVSAGSASKVLAPIDYSLKALDFIKIIGATASATIAEWKNFLIILHDQIEHGETSVTDIIDSSKTGYFMPLVIKNNKARFVVEQYVYYSLREKGVDPTVIDMKGTFRKVLYAENGSYRAEYHKR